jgi:ATP adenylyltransferase
MEYILQDKQPTGPRDEGSARSQRADPACVFCDFAASGPATFRSKLVLLVQPHAFVCLNKYPFAAGHLLVVPRRHASSLSDLAAEEYDATMRLVRETVARLKRAMAPEGLNVGMNLGKAAGAGIADHLHAHVVPRWNGDTNFMPVMADVRIMPEYLDATWSRLAPAFADLPGDRADNTETVAGEGKGEGEGTQ